MEWRHVKIWSGGVWKYGVECWSLATMADKDLISCPSHSMSKSWFLTLCWPTQVNEGKTPVEQLSLQIASLNIVFRIPEKNPTFSSGLTRTKVLQKKDIIGTSPIRSVDKDFYSLWTLKKTTLSTHQEIFFSFYHQLKSVTPPNLFNNLSEQSSRWKLSCPGVIRIFVTDTGFRVRNTQQNSQFFFKELG